MVWDMVHDKVYRLISSALKDATDGRLHKEASLNAQQANTILIN